MGEGGVDASALVTKARNVSVGHADAHASRADLNRGKVRKESRCTILHTAVVSSPLFTEPMGKYKCYIQWIYTGKTRKFITFVGGPGYV